MAIPRLTLTYIVEPPEYDILACSLLASIRTHFPKSVACVGYVPEHRMDEVHPSVFKAHDIMGAAIRPMKTEGMWEEPYPHGNKIIAAMQPRDSLYSAFVDSDVLFLKDNTVANLAKPDHVSCSMAASMVWAEQSIWDDIYGAFNMPIPKERMTLMRRTRTPVIPYFSAGFVIFPEKDGKMGRFPDVWYETAREIDKIKTLEKRRPYLDQMSLPVAIQRAGLKWNVLPEEQHYILGRMMRGKPLPEDRDIYTIHYRSHAILREVGKMKYARQMLADHTGEQYVRRLTEPKDDS